MQAVYQMTFAQKERSRRQIQLEPHSGNRKEREDVLVACGSQPHDLRINELFTSKPGLPEKPPNSRMKPERCGDNFFNDGYEPVAASNVKEFVTRNSVLPCRLQAKEGFWKQDGRAQKPNGCRNLHFFRNTKERVSADAFECQADRVRKRR
jgi:hypothetical protein